MIKELVWILLDYYRDIKNDFGNYQYCLFKPVGGISLTLGSGLVMFKALYVCIYHLFVCFCCLINLEKRSRNKKKTEGQENKPQEQN